MRISLFNQQFVLDEQYVENTIAEVRRQIHEYGVGKRTRFTLRITWDQLPCPHSLRAIANIPYGQTATYGNIARQIGGHPRAVGVACHHNPLPLCIPCHRVVGAQDIGGYGYGTATKRQLLHLENAQ